MRRDIGRVQRDIAWGIGWGLRIAGGFTVLAIGIAVVSSLVSAPSSQLMTFLGQTLAIYLWGAFTAGAVVGLLRPLGRNWLGAATMGFAAGLPVTVGGYLILLGFGRMSLALVLLSVGQALLAGGLAGIMIWRHRSYTGG
jgi:hypothetical protein